MQGAAASGGISTRSLMQQSAFASHLPSSLLFARAALLYAAERARALMLPRAVRPPCHGGHLRRSRWVALPSLQFGLRPYPTAQGFGLDVHSYTLAGTLCCALNLAWSGIPSFRP